MGTVQGLGSPPVARRPACRLRRILPLYHGQHWNPRPALWGWLCSESRLGGGTILTPREWAVGCPAEVAFVFLLPFLPTSLSPAVLAWVQLLCPSLLGGSTPWMCPLNSLGGLVHPGAVRLPAVQNTTARSGCTCGRLWVGGPGRGWWCTHPGPAPTIISEDAGLCPGSGARALTLGAPSQLVAVVRLGSSRGDRRPSERAGPVQLGARGWEPGREPGLPGLCHRAAGVSVETGAPGTPGRLWLFPLTGPVRSARGRPSVRSFCRRCPARVPLQHGGHL